MRIIGRDRVSARLRALGGDEAVREVGKALFVAADEIKVYAQHSITDGSISGKAHIPSDPGEPPNADTHRLDTQIESQLVEPLKAIVASNDPKSKFLEFGTSIMAARPFMTPAAEAKRQRATELVAGAMNRVTSGSGSRGD
jgi:HK97 gp10 family phage protein